MNTLKPKALSRGRNRVRIPAHDAGEGRRFKALVEKVAVSARSLDQDPSGGPDSSPSAQTEAINVANALWLVNDAIMRLEDDRTAHPDSYRLAADPAPVLDVDGGEPAVIRSVRLRSWKRLPAVTRRRIGCGCARAANGHALGPSWTAAERELIGRMANLSIVRSLCRSHFDELERLVIKGLDSSRRNWWGLIKGIFTPKRRKNKNEKSTD